MWWRGPRGNNVPCLALGWFSVTSPAIHNQIGPFWCWFLGGWVCVCSQILWVSPMDSPVRLGVPSTTAIPQCFITRGFEALFPCTGTLSCTVYLTPAPVVPPSLSACECGTVQSASRHLIWSTSGLPPCPPWSLTTALGKSSPPSCLSPPLLLAWMNVSSLTPWLSDFHTVQFSVSSG